MTDLSPLGEILSGRRARNAVLDSLKLWLPTYLAHVARSDDFADFDVDLVAMPKSWNDKRAILDRWPQEQVPAIYVVSKGIADRPRVKADGSLTCKWVVGVAPVVESIDQESANALAELYGAAVMGALVQNPALGGPAEGCDFLAMKYDPVPADRSRSMAGADLAFLVTIPNVVNRFEGIDEPTTGDPPAEPDAWPQAETVEVEIEREPKE